MELKEFIAQTMKGIKDGITECEKLGVKIKKEDAFNDVVFDVAVTVGDTKEKGAGGSITVMGINLGGKAKKQETSSAVSRINFHITHDPS
jgi:anionic cell wall polymer biosynthesis LytR-Cps2A-Psr (LCP) family protein